VTLPGLEHGPLAAPIGPELGDFFGAPVIRGSVENKAFLAFWQHRHSVVAGMSVNWPRADKP
jgi:hypothetical protein